MDIAILLQMSGIINRHSVRYEANVPNQPVQYVRLNDGKLTTCRCNALRIVARPNYNTKLCKRRLVVYEPDIEKIIRQISRHNQGLAERVRDVALTPMDVDIIIRRATYHSLKLQLVPSPFYVSGNDKSDS